MTSPTQALSLRDHNVTAHSPLAGTLLLRRTGDLIQISATVKRPDCLCSAMLAKIIHQPLVRLLDLDRIVRMAVKRLGLVESVFQPADRLSCLVPTRCCVPDRWPVPSDQNHSEI